MKVWQALQEKKGRDEELRRRLQVLSTTISFCGVFSLVVYAFVFSSCLRLALQEEERKRAAQDWRLQEEEKKKKYERKMKAKEAELSKLQTAAEKR